MLARYTVLHELGRGAMGAVYAARDRETGGVVALKRLDPALLSKSDAGFANRFLKHARAARLLRHRNIAQVHDAGEVGGTVYVAMEMLEGRSLRSILDAGPVPVGRAVQIAHDIACGLAHAHLEGVVHGAIKPSNVIVLPSGAVKITDFGIGQLGQAAGARAGGLSYLSPEQVRGDPVDHRCDIFSLGALLYEMLTHRLPFEGGSPKEILENIGRAKPPLPSDLNQHVPRALDAIVFSMLAAQPAGRMPGVPILLRDLQRLEEGLGLGSGPSAGTDEPQRRAAGGDASASCVRADSSAAEEFRRGHRITDQEAFDYQKAMVMMEREARQQRSSRSRPAIFAAAFVAALGIGVAGFLYYSPGPSELATVASLMRQAPAKAPEAPRPAALPPAPADDGQAKQEPLNLLSGPNPEPPKPPASAGTAPALEPARAMQPAAKVPQRQPGGTARLILAVSPRGEVYIDGKHHGTTPPITTLDLEPGMHRVEVRSGSRKPYLTYMTVQPGEVRRIRHDFNASRAVLPPKSASWQDSSRLAR